MLSKRYAICSSSSMDSQCRRRASSNGYNVWSADAFERDLRSSGSLRDTHLLRRGRCSLLHDPHLQDRFRPRTCTPLDCFALRERLLDEKSTGCSRHQLRLGLRSMTQPSLPRGKSRHQTGTLVAA
jgi:hypothetical protein